MDITQLTEDQLKARAYDNLAQINRLQRGLEALEAELAKRSKPTDTIPKEPSEGTPVDSPSEPAPE